MGAFLAALVAVASHLLLDFTNMYGIRLLLPFSSAWQRLDLTPVVDVWIWTAIFVAIAGPFLGRLVVAEIRSGKTKSGRYGTGFAWAVLVFLLAYNSGRAVLHARAAAVLDSRLYRGAEPLRVAALPGQNPVVWRGLVETEAFYAVEDLNLTGNFDPGQGDFYYKPESSPAFEAARETIPFRVFLEFSQFPLWRVAAVSESPGAKLVGVIDMRFGTPAEPGLGVSAVVEQTGKVAEAGLHFGQLRAH
jgi:inner membrane protein